MCSLVTIDSRGGHSPGQRFTVNFELIRRRFTQALTHCYRVFSIRRDEGKPDELGGNMMECRQRHLLLPPVHLCRRQHPGEALQPVSGIAQERPDFACRALDDIGVILSDRFSEAQVAGPGEDKTGHSDGKDQQGQEKAKNSSEQSALSELFDRLVQSQNPRHRSGNFQERSSHQLKLSLP